MHRARNLPRVVLIAMPWHIVNRPSAAIGLLSGFVKHHEPEISVTAHWEYLNVAQILGNKLYSTLSDRALGVGEALYAQLVHPETRERSQTWAWEELKKLVGSDDPLELGFDAPAFAECRVGKDYIAELSNQLSENLDSLINATAKDADIIGLTTTFYSLYSSVAFAKRAKEAFPNVKIVLGGATLSGQVGHSLIKEYSFIDYIVQGEGELPFLHLVRNLNSGSSILDATRGLLTRTNFENFPNGAEVWGISKMDELPYPDYDGFAKLADERHIPWELPIEGSRGCWWDRVKKTGNVKDTCYFCSLNVVFDGYREKSPPRLAQEIEALSEKYSTGYIAFLDNIIRAKGIDQLATVLNGIGRDLYFLYEMRSSVSPHDLVLLWETGLDSVQFGIEALSTSLLQKLGKGTSTIQNLQAMKTCAELRLNHQGNLIVNFPTSTNEEVLETVKTIYDYAYAYQPLLVSPFMVQAGTAIEALKHQFNVREIKNADYFAASLPQAVYERLVLFDKAFETFENAADWRPVREALKWWRQTDAVKASNLPRMCYLDGGSFLRIMHAAWGNHRALVFKGLERELYLYCLEIRSIRQIGERFKNIGIDELKGILDYWKAMRIVFEEKDTYLSLACAPTPHVAAARIRREQAAKKTASNLANVTSPLNLEVGPEKVEASQKF